MPDIPLADGQIKLIDGHLCHLIGFTGGVFGIRRKGATMHLINRFAASVAFATALVVAAAFAALPADASTIDWVLSGVTFDDGGTANGTFSTDSISGDVTAFNITTTAGTTLGGAVYDSTAFNTFFSNGIRSPNSFILSNFNTRMYINLEFVNPLTGAGIDELILSGGGNYASYECAFCNPVRGIISGEAIETTPLPAALPLFATGLSAMGLLGWRRKRKAQATA